MNSNNIKYGSFTLTYKKTLNPFIYIYNYFNNLSQTDKTIYEHSFINSIRIQLQQTLIDINIDQNMICNKSNVYFNMFNASVNPFIPNYINIKDKSMMSPQNPKTPIVTKKPRPRASVLILV